MLTILPPLNVLNNLSMSADCKISCVLFDLDGTLVDTAPDLIACLNQALEIHHQPPVSNDFIKPYISYGAAAMIRNSLDDQDDPKLQEKILETMLELYQNNIARHTEFFSGICQTLRDIERIGLKWGVITNKRERFTLPLMEALKLSHRAACIISGDSTGNSKPHPEPMLAGCRQAQVEPCECVYIGDAAHDITAGKRANMKTLAASYGYIKPDDNPEAWGADAIISHPDQILPWISAILCH